jgi:hypothetical protein
MWRRLIGGWSMLINESKYSVLSGGSLPWLPARWHLNILNSFNKIEIIVEELFTCIVQALSPGAGTQNKKIAVERLQNPAEVDLSTSGPKF